MLGIPYQLGGRTKEGADCYGLVYLILQEHGYTLPKYDFNYTMNERIGLIKENSPLLLGESLQKPEDLCIVLFYRGKYPAHIGVYEKGNIWHTTQSTDSVCESYSSVKKRYSKVEFWRVKDSYSTKSGNL